EIRLVLRELLDGDQVEGNALRERQAGRECLGRSLLEIALSAQATTDSSVTLVTRVFENLVAGLFGIHQTDRERLRVRQRILDRGDVLNRRGVDRREALRELHLFTVTRTDAVAADAGLTRHVPGLDHERVAVPIAAGVAHVLADIFLRMG